MLCSTYLPAILNLHYLSLSSYDLVYNSFTLGMEDHLLEIFGGHDTKEVITKGVSADSDLNWNKEAQTELNKVPAHIPYRKEEQRK